MVVLILLAAPHGSVWVAAAVSCGLFLTWLTATTFGISRIGVKVSPLLKKALTLVLMFTGMYAVSKLLQGHPLIQGMTLPLGLTVLIGTCASFASLTCLEKTVWQDFILISKGKIRGRSATRAWMCFNYSAMHSEGV